MNFQDRLKVFKRSLARYGLFISSWFLTRLPYGLLSFVASGFIRIGYCFILRQRQIARESLYIAFGKEKSALEIEKIARDCFWNLGQGMIELIYFMAHPAMISEKVTVQGKEYLDQAFKAGNGVIAVSAHFGNFPLMLLRFARMGYKTNAIIRATRDEEIEKYFLEQRTKLGLNTVYSHPRKT